MYWSDCCLEVENRFYKVRGLLGGFVVGVGWEREGVEMLEWDVVLFLRCSFIFLRCLFKMFYNCPRQYNTNHGNLPLLVHI